MMKMIRILFLVAILFAQQVYSQKIITVQSGVNVFHYSTLDSAIANSITGDQIYVPGGSYFLSSINKSVLIIGAGHYPDSTLATGVTTLVGDLVLLSGASGGGITGCNINGNIIVGSGTAGSDSVSNFTISRCCVNTITMSSTGAPPTLAKNFSISDNVIRVNLLGGNAPNLNIARNILQGGIRYFDGATFVNNDFIGLGNCTNLPNPLTDVVSSAFENNIFLFSTPASCPNAGFFSATSTGNSFTNNIFKMTITFPTAGNTGVNNFINQPVSSIYNTALGDTFIYTESYHLKSTSPGILAGTDHFDIGIFGTLQPYKEGGVPFNPHIGQKSIATSTDPQGNLNIQIRVAAQGY